MMGATMRRTLAVVLTICGLDAGCQPTIRVEAPDKPIVINMNIKIEQDVRVRLEKDVQSLLQQNPNLF